MKEDSDDSSCPLQVWFVRTHVDRHTDGTVGRATFSFRSPRPSHWMGCALAVAQTAVSISIYRNRRGSREFRSGSHPGCRRGRHPAARNRGVDGQLLLNSQWLAACGAFLPPGWKPSSTAGRMPAATWVAAWPRCVCMADFREAKPTSNSGTGRPTSPSWTAAVSAVLLRLPISVRGAPSTAFAQPDGNFVIVY